MNPQVGFVTVPRTELNRPAGAFFFATVESKVGEGAWLVRFDGKSVTVRSELDLSAGQVLRLKLASTTGGRWVFQVLPKEEPPAAQSEALAAFVSKGLPAAAERLTVWTKWLAKPGPSDKADWAGSLEARGASPDSPLARALDGWLAWQAALERGDSAKPPEDDVWDLWNARKPAGDGWLVVPLTWEYQEHRDSGLLQALWNPIAQTVDRWNLTAAPAGVPFRLEARSRPGALDLVWRFFRAEDRMAWERRTQRWEQVLSTPDCSVSLRADGPAPRPEWKGGIDVRV